MTEKFLARSLMIACASAGIALSLPAAAQVDEDAAKLLFKQNECSKCHNPDKAKKGPSIRKMAKDAKAKPDPEKYVIGHLTKGAKVKLDDGSEAEHKIVDSKDPKALKNLAQWILSH